MIKAPRLLKEATHQKKDPFQMHHPGRSLGVVKLEPRFQGTSELPWEETLTSPDQQNDG